MRARFGVLEEDHLSARASWSSLLPESMLNSDVKAACRDGVLEVNIAGNSKFEVGQRVVALYFRQ